MGLAHISGSGQQLVDDPRTEIDQLRRTDLIKIARSRGMKITGHPTKTQLIKLFDANGVEASFLSLQEAQARKEDAKPTIVDHEAEMEAFAKTLEEAKWFTLVKFAEDYDVEVPEKGTDNRSDVLRQAILKAAMNG